MSYKKRQIWNLPGLEDRALALIKGGILLKDGNPQSNLYAELIKNCSHILKEGGKKLTKGILAKHFNSLVWGEGRRNFVLSFVSNGFDPKDLQEHLPFIPKNILDEKIREFRGHTVPRSDFSSDAGMGRLTTKEDIAAAKLKKFPTATLAEPLTIVLDKKPAVLVVNAPHIGTLHNEALQQNVVRAALFAAEQSGDSAVLLTGGLWFIDTRRGQSELTDHRARISSVRFDQSFIDPRYRTEAVRIRKDPPPDEVSYETLRERFMTLLAGWRKIVTKSDGSPVFSGRIYITFGPLEEQLIESGAHAEIRYMTILKRLRIERDRAERQLLLKQECAEHSDSPCARTLAKEIEGLLDQGKRTIETNVSHEDRKRFFEIMRAFVVTKIQDTIPHSVVIGQGSAFVRLDRTVVEIHQMRDLEASDGFLNRFDKDNAGRRDLDQSLPDAVLIAAPFPVRQGWNTMERPGKSPTHIFQLPAALDKKFLRGRMHGIIRNTTPFERLVHHPLFEPGVLRLSLAGGVLRHELISIESLTMPHSSGQKQSERYLYLFGVSDLHLGHPWIELFWDTKSGRFMTIGSAVMELMRRGIMKRGKLLPIHALGIFDDLNQGHNFETQDQPHQNALSFRDLEGIYNELCGAMARIKDPAEAVAILERQRPELLKQFWLRGLHWPQSQFDLFVKELLRPNVDFFAGVLRRGQKAHVHYLGASDLLGTQYDSRDFAAISLGSGNHMGNTIENKLSEGALAATVLQALLLSQPGCASLDLERLVRGPLFGNIPSAIGHIQCGDKGYQWGISYRRDPPSAGKTNGDPLLSAARKIIERGNFSRIFGGVTTVHFNGDKHRYGDARVTDALLVQSAAGTGPDPYGERGFGANNVGAIIVGLPVNGPTAGPIRIIPVNQDVVRRELLSSSQSTLDWDLILPDPA